MKKLILTTMRKELKRFLAQHAEHLQIRSFLVRFEGQQIVSGLQIAPGLTVINSNGVFTVISKSNTVHKICYGTDAENFQLHSFDFADIDNGENSERAAKKIQAVLSDPAQCVRSFTELKKVMDSLCSVIGRNFNDCYSYGANPAVHAVFTALGISNNLVLLANSKC